LSNIRELGLLVPFSLGLAFVAGRYERDRVAEDSRVVKRTDSSRLDHVADGESLDGLVLWCASGAVGAADRVYVATSLLVTSTIGPPLVLCILDSM
jgi:hypothetical protein